MKFEGFDIYISDKPAKKYYAVVGKKKVYFGARGYEQFHDKLGHYKKYDHNDVTRKNSYYKRHNINYQKGSADWFSKNILW